MKKIDRLKLRRRLMFTHWYMTGNDNPGKMLYWDFRLAQNSRTRLICRAWVMYSDDAQKVANGNNAARFKRDLMEAIG